MDSKLIIFVVLASLAKISVALPLIINYGLSDDQLAPLTRIIVDQEATIEAKIDSFNPIFDIIEKHFSPLIWNVQVGTDDESSKMAEALVRAKDSVDYSLHALLISLQKTCSVVEDARNAAHANLEDAYAVIADAFILAKSGNYTANRAQLEEYKIKVQKRFANLVSSGYDSFRSCLGTEDAAALALFDWAQDGSALGLDHATNAIFSAMNLYSVAVTVERVDVSLINEIENFRIYSHVGLRSHVEYKFSAIKTFYIATRLDQSKIFSGLASNQYALTATSYRFEASLKVTFSAIYASLKKITLGLYDIGNDDFSAFDAAEAEAAAKFNAGNDKFLMSVLSVYPDATSAIAIAEEMISAISTNAVTTFFEAMKAALFQGTESLDEIESLKNLLIYNAKPYTDLFYNLLRNGEIWDDDSEVELTILQEAGTDQIRTLVKSIFGAITALAKAASAGKVSDADFIAIQIAEDAAISASDAFSQGVSAAGVIVLKANNTSDAFSKLLYENRDHF